MWNKGNFFIIYVKINKFILYIPLPLFVLKSLIWDFIELFDLIGWKAFTFRKGISFGREQMIILTDVAGMLFGSGKYDLVDVDVKSDKDNVKVKIKVR